MKRYFKSFNSNSNARIHTEFIAYENTKPIKIIYIYSNGEREYIESKECLDQHLNLERLLDRYACGHTYDGWSLVEISKEEFFIETI